MYAIRVVQCYWYFYHIFSSFYSVAVQHSVFCYSAFCWGKMVEEEKDDKVGVEFQWCALTTTKCAFLLEDYDKPFLSEGTLQLKVKFLFEDMSTGHKSRILFLSPALLVPWYRLHIIYLLTCFTDRVSTLAQKNRTISTLPAESVRFLFYCDCVCAVSRDGWDVFAFVNSRCWLWIMLRYMTHEEENISRSVCCWARLDTGQSNSSLRDGMQNRSLMSFVWRSGQIWVAKLWLLVFTSVKCQF